ncbi:MAG: hypothetical protein ACYTXY_04325, partial [Nostoc sp.]
MFYKKVQSYINQIIVEDQEIQQDEKVFCLTQSYSASTNSSYRLRKIRRKHKALKQLQAETAKLQAVEAQLHQKTSEFAAILQMLPDLYFRLD